MYNLTTRQKNILAILKQKQNYLTAQEISTKLGVSVRTVKTDINLMFKILKDNLIIESKIGKGYHLIHDENGLIDELNIKDINNIDIPNDTKSRINYVIQKLITEEKYIKADDLAGELFISRSSLNQMLKEVKIKLADFRLKITSRPNYGLIIKGNEVDKRLAISEYCFYKHEDDITDFYKKIKSDFFEESAEAISYINLVCKKFNIETSEFSINNLCIDINVAISRILKNHFVNNNDVLYRELYNSSEYNAAKELIQLLELKYKITIPKGEIIYFAQQIKSKRILDENILDEIETKKLKSCLKVIFSEINNNFELNLSENSELYDYLFLHIPQMILRLKYHMSIKNPLVNDYMRRYLFATKVTHSACAVIEQFYNVKVDLNEFGYLLLYFNLAITKFETDKQINIGILTGRGRVESLMYFNEISEHFSSHKYNVEVINDLNKCLNYDLIITNYKLEKEVNFPYFVISSDSYIDEISEKINEIRYNNINITNYFKPEYCDFDLEGDSREEVLNNFYRVLLEKDIIKEKPQSYNSFIDDELGNGIVHFQDSYRIVRKSLCYVCTLKKPIYWNKKNVRILILTKTKKDYDKDLYNLCRIVSRWSNDIKKVSYFLKKQSFEVLLEGIKKYSI